MPASGSRAVVADPVEGKTLEREVPAVMDLLTGTMWGQVIECLQPVSLVRFSRTCGWAQKEIQAFATYRPTQFAKKAFSGPVPNVQEGYWTTWEQEYHVQ